jgi:hypothetical protein
MKKIFSDFEIIKLIKDHEAPGVFLKAKKISNTLIDLSNIALYLMILGKRTTLYPNYQICLYKEDLHLNFQA